MAGRPPRAACAPARPAAPPGGGRARPLGPQLTGKRDTEQPLSGRVTGMENQGWEAKQSVTSSPDGGSEEQVGVTVSSHRPVAGAFSYGAALKTLAHFIV